MVLVQCESVNVHESHFFPPQVTIIIQNIVCKENQLGLDNMRIRVQDDKNTFKVNLLQVSEHVYRKMGCRMSETTRYDKTAS